jgi:hypothetical protein
VSAAFLGVRDAVCGATEERITLAGVSSVHVRAPKARIMGRRAGSGGGGIPPSSESDKER